MAYGTARITAVSLSPDCIRGELQRTWGRHLINQALIDEFAMLARLTENQKFLDRCPSRPTGPGTATR